MIQKTNLYALFIGINDYQADIVLHDAVCFPKLGGCINDVQNFQNFLKADPCISLHPQMLLDAQASKRAIVTAFEEHLSKAKKDDTVVIYYAGHGSMEYADVDTWKAESDGRLESLVCYYDNSIANNHANFLLADKELRFLLNQLWEKTGAHISLFFDCCHSGDNVRALQEEETIRARRATDGAFVFPKRKYDEFLFSKNIAQNDFKNKGIDDVLPSGQFIQMAAAESNESALEVGGSGVFSVALLEALKQSGGHLSYQELHSRVSNTIRFKYAQRPKLYSPEISENLKSEGFLKKEINGLNQTATISYNKSEGWIMNRGSLHGVEDSKTKLLVEYDGRAIEGKVKKTALDYSIVQFNNMDLVFLREKKHHTVVVNNLTFNLLRIQIINKEVPNKKYDSFIETLSIERNAAFFSFEDRVEKTDYALYFWNGLAYITKPNDPFRPVTRAVSIEDENAADILAADLRHIAKWQSYLHFENKDKAALDKSALQIRFFAEEADGTLELLNHKKASAEIDFIKSSNGKYRRNVRVQVTNKSNTDLYVALAFLDFDFTSMNTLLHEPIIMLGPNESRWVRDQKNNTIPLKLDPVALYYNWEKTTTHFKFIFSKENFDASVLALGALPQPEVPNAIRSRGSFDNEEDQAISINQWATQSFELSLRNPHFNALPQAIIQEMIPESGKPTTESLAHFGIGLYAIQNEKSEWEINPEIKAAKDRNIAWKLALKGVNTWANYWRNKKYASMRKKFPNHPRIVSEGDSWFQHPLLTDIIDQVGVFYPTYCIAAAGDTIMNYVKTGIFTETIEEIKPDYFLLSGGGNDILGESIRNFLNKNTDSNCPDGENCERFFNSNLNEATKTLLDLYETTFGILATEYPHLKILVHGYDYPIPIAPKAKKMSWMGKYFDEFDIIRPLDRRAASHYLMDTFNSSLKTLAESTDGQVHYIDLRGTVGEQEWYDEIHPNDTGYQKVALKFIKKITQLRQNS